MSNPNLYLKVKIKTLAAEALIIRQQEHKYLPEWRLRKDETYFSLRHHRTLLVRNEQRAALLVYGYLRGREYHMLEEKCYEKPNWERVAEILRRFGPPGTDASKEGLLVVLKTWSEKSFNAQPKPERKPKPKFDYVSTPEDDALRAERARLKA
jgi:hypothetical protein